MWSIEFLPPRDTSGIVLVTCSIMAIPFVAVCTWMAAKAINQRGIPWRAVMVSSLALVVCGTATGVAVFYWAVIDAIGSG